MSRLAGLALAAALGLAGCSAVGVTTQAGEMVSAGEPACPAERFERGVRVLACAEAVRAAEKELGAVHWPVSSANFARGTGNCPKMPSRLMLRGVTIRWLKRWSRR